MAYYHLTRSAEQYMFNMRGDNHEKVLTSERYTTKQSAQNGIASCKANSPHDSRYSRRTASNGSPYFVLTGSNGEVIGTSELYSSTSAREAGIEWMKKNGPSAPTIDGT